MTDSYMTWKNIPKPSYDEVFSTIYALKFIFKDLIGPKVKLAYCKIISPASCVIPEALMNSLPA
jgi:hypothetical protein